MSVGAFPSEAISLTQTQRWSLYLTLGFGLVGLIIGVNLRDSALSATDVYTNVEVGLEARYPQNWLIDEAGEYIFRVQDVSRVGYKTLIQVAILLVNPGVTNERNVLDSLTLSRAQTLTDYSVQIVRDYVLPDETPATRMDYTFVASDADPFLESVPVVVQGVDVVVIRRGQAIVVTLWADRTTFDQDLSTFEQFLSDLKF